VGRTLEIDLQNVGHVDTALVSRCNYIARRQQLGPHGACAPPPPGKRWHRGWHPRSRRSRERVERSRVPLISGQLSSVTDRAMTITVPSSYSREDITTHTSREFTTTAVHQPCTQTCQYKPGARQVRVRVRVCAVRKMGIRGQGAE
jgi:hypothetical protein